MSNYYFDLDGTLTKPLDKELIEANYKSASERKEKYIKRLGKVYFNQELQLLPIVPFGIITARPSKYKSITIDWLRHYKLNPYIIIMPAHFLFGFKERADFKAKAINNFGVKIYYEDEAKIRKELETLCPDCKTKWPYSSVSDGNAIPPLLEDRVYVI